MTNPTYTNITMSRIVPPNGPVRTVLRNSPLREAVKIMSKNSFSQLPVIPDEDEQKVTENTVSQVPVLRNGGVKPLRKNDIVGLLSWEQICEAMVYKDFDLSRPVSDFMDTNLQWYECPDTAPVVEVVSNLLATNREYVLVMDKQQLVLGLVTYYDIAKLYIRMVEPFSIIESIELALRKRLGKLTPEELGRAAVRRAQEEGKEVFAIEKGVDNLVFSEYLELIRLFYDKLDFNCDLKDLIEILPKVNSIRNTVMHFRPEGIKPDDLKELKWLEKLLK